VGARRLLPILIATLASTCLAAATPATSAHPPIHVVLRTAADVVCGHDLRYADGTFRISLENGDEAAFPEAQVVRVALLRPLDPVRLGAGDPYPQVGQAVSSVVGLVVRVAVLSRPPAGARAASRKGLLFPNGVFLLPREPFAETFLRFVPKVQPPELVAVLCAEMVRVAIAERRPTAMLDLLRKGEGLVPKGSAQAIVYALMQVAVLFGQGREAEGEEAVRQLVRSHPGHRRDAQAALVLLRRRFESRLPGRRRPDRPSAK